MANNKKKNQIILPQNDEAFSDNMENKISNGRKFKLSNPLSHNPGGLSTVFSQNI